MNFNKFLQEIYFLNYIKESKVDCESMVHLEDYFIMNGQLFLVTNFKGNSLRKYISKNKFKFTEIVVDQFIKDLTNALE